MSSPVSSPQLASSACTPKPTFAVAKIKGDVCLVQVPYDSPARGAMSSALMAADVHVFRHEFITLFRYSHCATVHPADMHILESIDDRATLYEEDKGTVFLARDVMAKIQKLTMDSRRPGAGRYYRPRQSSAMSMSRPVHAPTRSVRS
ncbi:hypothetical protein GSI_10870 [Ganoderma sinense ZZ0214-1]|uniref:Uncharacterized protein n=1 Tax=Ganoderma sinense ZZ0214-1 TaxID=1077348 RepID=A0A2G8S1V8_9APHY|nr:hypothetical protein GSI_10870 [Ganoderma sinense ZZ0214-1]